MPPCPTCGVDTTLYECPECGVEHCVDHRLADTHNCDPDTDQSSGLTVPTLIGFSGKQWAAVILWWLFTIVGSPSIQSLAGIVGAFVGAIAVVLIVSGLWAKLRSFGARYTNH